MSLAEIDTIEDLKEWLWEAMPGATVVEGEGEIIIRTGLVSTMGGYLHALEGEGECAYCEAGIAEIHKHERGGEQ